VISTTTFWKSVLLPSLGWDRNQLCWITQFPLKQIFSSTINAWRWEWKRFLKCTGCNKFSRWTKFKITLFSIALHNIQKHSNSTSSLALLYPTIWPTKHNHLNLIIQSTVKNLCKSLSASSYKLIFFVFIEINELVHQVVTHLTCICELLISNISQDTSYPSWDFS